MIFFIQISVCACACVFFPWWLSEGAAFLAFWTLAQQRKKTPNQNKYYRVCRFQPETKKKKQTPRAHKLAIGKNRSLRIYCCCCCCYFFLVCERSAHSQKRYGKMCACVSVVAVASAGCCLSVAWLFGSCQFNENLLLFYMYGVCVWVRVCVYALLYFRTRRSVRFGLVGFWLACNVFLCSFFFSAGCSHTSSICCYSCRFFFISIVIRRVRLFKQIYDFRFFRRTFYFICCSL